MCKSVYFNMCANPDAAMPCCPAKTSCHSFTTQCKMSFLWIIWGLYSLRQLYPFTKTHFSFKSLKFWVILSFFCNINSETHRLISTFVWRSLSPSPSVFSVRLTLNHYLIFHFITTLLPVLTEDLMFKNRLPFALHLPFPLLPRSFYYEGMTILLHFVLPDCTLASTLFLYKSVLAVILLPFITLYPQEPSVASNTSVLLLFPLQICRL